MVEVDASRALAAAGMTGGAATSSDAALAGGVDFTQQGMCSLGAVVVVGANVEGTGDVADSLFPGAHQLPVRPPRAIECNYTHWAALDMGKEFHDQYVYRHANGLCVIGLLPTHAAFKPTPAITAVDFNVGKQNRADTKVSGKRKKNAISLEPNSVLCKVLVGEAFYMIRCCVRGAVLEVNERLIKDPTLLNKRVSLFMLIMTSYCTRQLFIPITIGRTCKDVILLTRCHTVPLIFLQSAEKHSLGCSLELVMRHLIFLTLSKCYVGRRGTCIETSFCSKTGNRMSERVLY